MVHVKLCNNWAYSPEPFPAYRIWLYYGSNKNQQKTLPCKVSPDEKGVLPRNLFRVIKTEKGTIMVVSGSDTTNRCLLMVGCSEGFRGGVSIASCDGEILSQCYASSATEGYMSVAVILNVGQKIVFHRTGRGIDQYIEYTFNGTNVKEAGYTNQEYAQAADTSDDYVSL